MPLHNILMSKQGLKTHVEVATPASSDTLGSGQILLEIDAFALTANVVRLLLMFHT